MSGLASAHSRMRFGVFELDLQTGELRKSGVLLHLPPQPFKVLALLASRPGQLVTREEMQDQIWGTDTFVDFEHGLNFAIKKIRDTLGDDSDTPRYIETLPRRGYRFIAPAETVRANGVPPNAGLDASWNEGPAGLERMERSQAAQQRRWPPGVTVLLVLATVVALALSAVQYFRPKLSTALEPVRFEIPFNEAATALGSSLFSLSPDGRQLAYFVAGADNAPRLWIRAMDSLQARPLPGSESAVALPFFWSPDSRFIAFSAEGKLKKIALTGGPAQTLCEVTKPVFGGSWNRDGEIIFGQAMGGLMRVSAGGGTATPLTTVDQSRNEYRHSFPFFLPDGRHFVYMRASAKTENSGAYIGSLDAKPEEQNSKPLLITWFATAYVPPAGTGPGQLLFIRDWPLLARPFDPGRLEFSGEPVEIAEQVGSVLERGFFSASANGVLVYRTGGGQWSQLTWLDRQGKAQGKPTEKELSVYAAALSPDARLVAITRADPGASIWLRDFSRGTTTLFSVGPWASEQPVWSWDGKDIIFLSARDGGTDLYRRPANGAKDAQLILKSPDFKTPTSWSRDGRFLLYTVDDAKTKSAVWALPLQDGGKPFPIVRNEFNNLNGRISPDGRWVAYVSDENGRRDIFVRQFSADAGGGRAGNAGGKWLISIGGGVQPRWRGDGKELYYVSPAGQLMAVEVAVNPTLRAGVPKALFRAPSASYDVTSDGQRFLFVTPAEQTAQPPLTVVLNWQAALKK